MNKFYKISRFIVIISISLCMILFVLGYIPYFLFGNAVMLVVSVILLGLAVVVSALHFAIEEIVKMTKEGE